MRTGTSEGARLCAASLACALLLVAGSATADPGDLDADFGVAGKVRESLSRRDDYAKRLAVQEDGRIVTVGEAFRNGERDLVLARFLPDGALDESFGSGGSVLFGFKRKTERGAALAIQPDGRIVVVADVEKGEDVSRMLVARFLPDGRYDPEFGQKGRTTTAFDGTYLAPAAVIVAADGDIVVAGEGFIGGLSGTEARAWIFARYRPDGRLDRSFGRRGRVVLPLGQGAAALVEQADGKLVAGGSAGPGFVDFAVVRLMPDGTLDREFGDGGVALTSFGPDNDYVHGVGIDALGRIVAAGRSWSGFVPRIAVARYLADGTPDPGFGENGAVVTKIGSMSEAYDLVVADDRIAVVGWASVNRLAQFAVARYLDDGSLDPGFGAGGIVLTPLGRQAAEATTAALQGVDRLVVGGIAVSRRGRGDTALVRYVW